MEVSLPCGVQSGSVRRVSRVGAQLIRAALRRAAQTRCQDQLRPWFPTHLESGSEVEESL
jgi:hypothetical protein